MTMSATAAAHPNLALVKYWGRSDPALNIPANGSISVNLSGATTITSVAFDPALREDVVSVNGSPADVVAYRRVVAHLDRLRAMAGAMTRARVASTNDFPMAVGIASSASAFASLSLAASRALGLDLTSRQVSILARKGSGSACRSVPDGFVEWLRGHDDESSYAISLAKRDYWDLRILTIIISAEPKLISSLDGHRAARTSPFYAARLETIHQTLDTVRSALLARDFEALGMAAEREAMSLHAIAMTSRPEGYPWMSGIYYMAPETMRLIQAVQRWRAEGLAVYATLDAGPSLHLLCQAEDQERVARAVAALDGVPSAVLVSRPGRGAWLINETAEADASAVK